MKGCVPNWSEEVILIDKSFAIVPWTYLISDLNGEKIFDLVGAFFEKELQKINLKEWVEKVIKRKADKLYVK